MITPDTKNTHSTIRLNRLQWLLILLTSSLVFTLMSPIAAAKGKERSFNRAGKKTEVTVTTDSRSAKRPDTPTADRPGKPDDHNSNGDDIPVRPPRRAMRS